MGGIWDERKIERRITFFFLNQSHYMDAVKIYEMEL